MEQRNPVKYKPSMDWQIFQESGITFKNGRILSVRAYAEQMIQLKDKRKGPSVYRTSLWSAKDSRLLYQPIYDSFTYVKPEIAEFLPKNLEVSDPKLRNITQNYDLLVHINQSPRRIMQQIQKGYYSFLGLDTDKQVDLSFRDSPIFANFTHKALMNVGVDLLRPKIEKIKKFLELDPNTLQDHWDVALTINEDIVKEFWELNPLFFKKV